MISKNINIIILIKIFKTINKKIIIMIFLSDAADLKFESNININVSKRDSQSLLI